MTDTDTGTTPAQCARCGRAFRGGERFCEWCGAPSSADATGAQWSRGGGPQPSPSVGGAGVPPPPPPPPPGYGQVPYPPPGAVPLGYPGYLPSGQTTNGFSIAALVLGIVWVFGLGAILAVIFGFVARKQISESAGRQGGSGMATAGIVLGFVGIAGLILWIVVIVAVATNINNVNDCLNRFPNNPNSICGSGNSFNTGASGNGLNSGSLGNTGTSPNDGVTGSTPNGGSRGVVSGPAFAFF